MPGDVSMEPKPKIVEKSPCVKDEVAGKHAWCSCGESAKQPYCDGAHNKAGQFAPVKIVLEEDKKVAWCMCKNTKNPPYCDGSHKDL
jgi:CDGSH-type Zn-finger protein